MGLCLRSGRNIIRANITLGAVEAKLCRGAAAERRGGGGGSPEGTICTEPWSTVLMELVEERELQGDARMNEWTGILI